MNERQTCRCPACLMPDTAFVALDKRGRWYMRCRWCSATMFCPTPQAMTSILVFSKHIAQILSSSGTTERELQAEAMALLAAPAAAEK